MPNDEKGNNLGCLCEQPKFFSGFKKNKPSNLEGLFIMQFIQYPFLLMIL